MVNLLALPADGSRRAVFLGAIRCANVRKDASWIADKHAQFIEQLTSGEHSLCLGVHMDNTAANRCAMRTLEQTHPTMVSCATSETDLAVTVSQAHFAMIRWRASSCMHTIHQTALQVNIGCVAHGLNLLFKDIANTKKTTTCSKVRFVLISFKNARVFFIPCSALHALNN
jgi:hypothetical protein